MRTILVKHLDYLWNNTEKILIFVFFATFSFNIRKIFLTPLSYPKGDFNEYMTLSLNWSDILILSLIIIYIIKYIISQYINPVKRDLYQYNNNGILSRLKFFFRNVSHPTKTSAFFISSEIFLLFLFLLWLAVSTIWAPYRPIAFYRLFIILFIVIFVAIIGSLIKKDYVKAKIVYLSLIVGGIFQSLIGISQFILNRSLDLGILGESILGPNLPGVAKIIVSEVKHIRAYGTFPHPNILAGFLIIPIVLLVSILLERFEQSKSNDNKVSHETILGKIPAWLIFIILFINSSCFFLAFSRSAFLSIFFVGLALLLTKLAYNSKIIWLIMAIVIFATLFHGFFYVSRHSDIFFFSTQSLEERNQYLNVSRETIAAHPLLGVGLGQFVLQEIVSRPNWLGWQYQPVHNVYLLIASETGIVGLILFLLFLLTYSINYCINNFSFNILTIKPFCIIILSFLFISFFDHYFWDIKLGLIIFAIPFILNADSHQNHKKISGQFDRNL